MKRSASVAALAGLLICASSAFAQNVWHAGGSPSPQFNLNGIWQFTYNGKPIRMQVVQHADQFRSYAGQGNVGQSDALLFEGRYANGLIAGERIDADNRRVADRFTVEDPDHIRTSRGVVIVRITPARADDAICDLNNSSHTQAGFAYDRAIDAAHRNLPKTTSACWLQVAANQSHSRAEAVTAMIFRDGEGVPRNYSTAFSWAQKSAAQADPVGEAVLGQLYANGLGTPRNPQLSQYWESKANTQLAALRAKQQQAQTPQNDTAATASGRQTEAMVGLAVLLGMAIAADGGSSSNSESDEDAARESSRMAQEQREQEEQYQRHECEMRGGTVSEGIFSGFTCE